MKIASIKVDLVDHMGTDLTVVNAARVSFDKESDWEVVDHMLDASTWKVGIERRLSVAPEQARMILPQNMMTEWYWTGSLMFFARVCAQRLDPHAQAETSEVARQIADVVRPLFPVSWLALTGKGAV